MNPTHIGFAIIILISLIAGLVRVLRGPTAADRMMTFQLFGTSGVAILLLMSEGLGVDVLVDIALVFALLAALATITFVRRTWKTDTGQQEGGDAL